jgi:phage terminase large subunit
MQTTLPREIKGAATTGASACRAQYGSDCGKHAATRQDEKRNVVLGPEHDWSSNAADAFGYMAIV